MKHYRDWNPGQTFLLPPSPHDWLPSNHLVYLVLDVVGQLDIATIEGVYQAKDHRGTRPHSPAMMVGLLLYGYCVGVFSSRKLEKATYEDVAFRVLCAGNHPDHTRISEFRRVHLDALSGLFLQVLQICARAGLVKLGHVALDGTKIQASASKHKAMSYERMQAMEKRLTEEIAQLLARAEVTDADEDERYGVGIRGDELPDELKRREDRLARIREAKADLEREARQSRARRLRELAEQNRDTAEDEPDTRKGRSAATRAAKQEALAEELRNDDDDDDDPSSWTTPEGLPRHKAKARPDGTPEPSAQRNYTDPESRLMESGGSFLQAYNCQVAADSHSQVIVAQGVTNQPPDSANFVPMLDEIARNTGQFPDVMTADAGYWAKGVDAEATSRGTGAYIATERRRAYKLDDTVTEGAPPAEARELEAMRHKLRTVDGRALYAQRKAIVEPVHGQQKEVRGFRRFSLRGLTKVAGEFALLCTGHNLLKLHRSGVGLPQPA
jgi:transposase